jgi:hypothetical protein
MGSGFFKFFDLHLKFSDLEIGKTHVKKDLSLLPTHYNLSIYTPEHNKTHPSGCLSNANEWFFDYKIFKSFCQ